jgi:hypothetical protein
LPQGIAFGNIGALFVGQRRSCHILDFFDAAQGLRRQAFVSPAGAGFGKTRLALEYFHRFGVTYPGDSVLSERGIPSIEEGFTADSDELTALKLRICL